MSVKTGPTSSSEQGSLGKFRVVPFFVVVVTFLGVLNLLGLNLIREWRLSVLSWINETDAFTEVVHQVVNLTNEAESAINLYILMGDPLKGEIFLENERRVVEELLPRLEQLVVDSPSQSNQLVTFREEIHRRFYNHHRFLVSPGSTLSADVFKALEQGELNRFEGGVREAAQLLIQERDRLRDQRDREFLWSLKRFIFIIVACSSVLLVGLFVSIRRVQRELALRARAEGVARESERLEHARATELQTILETAPAVILIAQDRESRVLSGSRKAYDFLRLPLGANISKTALVAPPQHFQVFRDGRELSPGEHPVQTVARTGKAIRDVDIEVVFDDGEIRHLFGSVEPLFDEEGEPRGAIAAFTDVTARKEADLLLKASEARWKLSLETGQLGFFEYDYEHGTTRWSESEALLIGYEPGTILPAPENFFKAVHSDDRCRLEEEWRTALTAGKLDAEFRIVRPDGEVRWLVGKGTVIEDASGRKRWFTGVNIDITKAKRIEEDLSRAVRDRTEALNTLHTFMSAAPIGIGLFDNAGRCRFLNQLLAQMIGTSPENQIGKPLGAKVTILGSFMDLHLEKVVTEAITVRDYESQGESPAHPGESRTWIESMFPIHGGVNGITGVGVIVQDVTERKRAEAELARHRERLQELVQQKTRELAESLQRLHTSERLAALGTLAAGLGHDLANLVLPIRARLESLAISSLTPEMRGDVVAIGQALDHLSSLSAGMRLMALDPSRPRAASDATDLSTWWNEAQGVFRGVLPRHVRLEGKVGTGLGVTMPRHQLLQAVFNLVQNAAEVLDSREDSWVRVVIAPDPQATDSRVLIEVSDNGPGMTPEVKSRCFEPYFSTKGRAISTGMGLSLVRGFVESAGGTISVESSPRDGTCFKIRLPRRSSMTAMHLRSSRGERSAAISIAEPRQAALATMIAERLKVKVEDVGERETPATEVWITDGASRAEVEHFLGESGAHRVIYLGGRTFDPAAFDLDERYRGRVLALPSRPAPTVLRDAIAAVVGVPEEARV
ncbi:MAG: hypothetical protein RL417_1160 [Pseudomonadota bacterium]|jgi:PAS domain S-box-containing protein